MGDEPSSWCNRSPGDLSVVLEEVQTTPVEPVVEAAAKASRDWRRMPLEERRAHLETARTALAHERESLARGIALEVGKPLREALGEVDAVIAKFELTFEDAARLLPDEQVMSGPHPAVIRRRARGIAAIVGPFNFPLHLAHGAIVPHLLAGNPVIFKPSPFAAVVAARYAAILASALPAGVFGLVQGGAQTGERLCLDPSIGSICFTGSVAVGRRLAAALAPTPGKELALELGGKNAVIVLDDADLDAAAKAIADGACLTAGQRCNATSRVLYSRRIGGALMERVLQRLADYSPGDPLSPATSLGPLISSAAVERYRAALQEERGEWLLEGGAVESAGDKRGHYVRPALLSWADARQALSSRLWTEELFAPVTGALAVESDEEAVALANATPFGLTASVFTRSQERFSAVAEELEAGNVYANLPTTFSPSTLPFGGWKDSGNGRPGGRGFLRFVTQEQAVQMAAGAFTPRAQDEVGAGGAGAAERLGRS